MHFDRNALRFSPLPLKWHFLPSSAAGEEEKRGAVTGSSRVMCVRSQLLVKGLSRSSSGSLSTASAALQSSPILWSHTAVVLIGVSPSRAAQRRSPHAEGAGLGSCYFSSLCIPFAAVFLCPCCSISSVAGTEKHEHMRKVSGRVWCIHSYYLLKMRSLFIFNFSLYFIYFGSVFDYETEGGEKKQLISLLRWCFVAEAGIALFPCIHPSSKQLCPAYWEAQSIEVARGCGARTGAV